MQIRLLGGVEATDDRGRPVDLGAAKARLVLAALALDAGRAVPVARIVEAVWDESPPRTAEKTLQAYVTRLRNALGREAITRDGEAYMLALPPDAVDVVRFRRRLDAGDVAGALDEWTGDPLAGIDAPGLSPTLSGLAERWLGAMEADLGSRVERDPAGAMGLLTELTERHPYREGLWGLLMTALYRAGRQADALDAYRRARGRLVDDLGVEPGPALRAVQARILGQDAELAVPRPETARPAGDGDEVPPTDGGNLPRRAAHLIGRDDDLETVARALARSALVTITGPGGVGKTTLAVVAAQEAEPALEGGGVAWLVELTDVSAPDEAPRAVADALRVREAPGRSVTESLVAHLGSGHDLLVLDNCEHVIEGAARTAQDLLRGCPNLRILATSREPLGTSGEALVALAPLEPIEDGVALFNERARSARPDFDPAAWREPVTDICRRLDGLPLAIELVAARVRSLTPAEILTRLDDRLRLAAGGRRTPTERHRSLRATIRWSHDLLSDDERVLFRRLSVFAGTFDAPAAAAVAAPDRPPADAEDLLDRLADRSMLSVVSGPDGRRFRLLETIRQFAAEELAASGEAGEVARRHAEWCRDEIAIIVPLLAGHGEIEGVTRLDELWSNLRAAVDTATSTGDLDLALDLTRPIYPEIALRTRGEIADWIERILEIVPADDVATTAFCLLACAQRHMLAQDIDAYERLLARNGPADHPMTEFARGFVYDDDTAVVASAPAVAEAFRAQGLDHLARFISVGEVASILSLGDFDALDQKGRALATHMRAHGPPTLLSWSLFLLGMGAFFRTREQDADRLFAEAAAVDVPVGTLAISAPMEARAAVRRGEVARAVAILLAHIDDVVAAEVPGIARLTGIAFLEIMAALDRPGDAAPIVAHLGSQSGEFGALSARAIEASTADRLGEGATAPDGESPGPVASDAEALAYMRAVLAGHDQG